MKTRRDFLKKTAAGGMAGILASGIAPVYSQNLKTKKSEISLEDAADLHKRVLIIDGHNDTPVERIHRGENPMNWKRRDMAYHVDIPRMKEGNYGGGFFIVGNGPTANVWVTTERTLEQIEQNPGDLMRVLTSNDMIRAQKAGKIGIVLSIEGIGRWLDGNADTLRLMYRLGIRLAGISHGEGGSEPRFMQGSPSLYRPCTLAERENDRKNGVGLTPFGREVLKLSNELGMVTDLSHINDKAFYDVLEQSTLPTIMSHTAVYALCPHARCMTDEQIKALAATGGTMGVAFAPQFIHEDQKLATIDRLVEHVSYVADLVGVDYVSIGTDYDGLGTTVPVVPEVSQLVNLTRSMMAHGFSEAEIRKIWGGNFLRILRETVDRG
ncbi:membrane dipeptidase [Candidatus Latescibacterota bacterium]